MAGGRADKATGSMDNLVRLLPRPEGLSVGREPMNVLTRCPAPAAVRVVIADGQALMRAGLHVLLEGATSIDVVGEAADDEEAVAVARGSRADVVLVDAELPGSDFANAIRQLQVESGIAVMLLTESAADDRIVDALRAGASGMLLKDTDPPDLIRAVELLARGDAQLSPPIARRLLAELASQPEPPHADPAVLSGLTEREREVLTLVALGGSNGEIAEKLVVSPATAKTHVSRTMIKLGARDRAQLVVLAYEAGLVLPRAAAPVIPIRSKAPIGRSPRHLRALPTPQ